MCIYLQILGSRGKAILDVSVGGSSSLKLLFPQQSLLAPWIFHSHPEEGHWRMTRATSDHNSVRASSLVASCFQRLQHHRPHKNADMLASKC